MVQSIIFTMPINAQMLQHYIDHYNLNIVNDTQFENRPFLFLTTLVTLFTDFSYTNFTVSGRDALDRLRVHLNIILF